MREAAAKLRTLKPIEFRTFYMRTDFEQSALFDCRRLGRRSESVFGRQIVQGECQALQIGLRDWIFKTRSGERERDESFKAGAAGLAASS